MGGCVSTELLLSPFVMSSQTQSSREQPAHFPSVEEFTCLHVGCVQCQALPNTVHPHRTLWGRHGHPHSTHEETQAGTQYRALQGHGAHRQQSVRTECCASPVASGCLSSPALREGQRSQCSHPTASLPDSEVAVALYTRHVPTPADTAGRVSLPFQASSRLSQLRGNQLCFNPSFVSLNGQCRQ